MKINEVEQLVGITRRNIRFYEAEGLLTPARNSQNGYRDYRDAEVETLMRIKLMRKLGVPLEEIQRLQDGQGTVADGMRRHLVTLEREQHDLEQNMELCNRLKEEHIRLADLDVQQWLDEMDSMEKMGTTFQNKQKGDVKMKRYVPSVVAAFVIVLFMAWIISLIVWAATMSAGTPIVLLIVMALVPAVIIFGVVLALIQRWKEIRRGEEDEAKKY